MDPEKHCVVDENANMGSASTVPGIADTLPGTNMEVEHSLFVEEICLPLLVPASVNHHPN